MGRLAKLVALANRPGYPEEGVRARRKAEREAAAQGLALVEIRGELVAVEEWRADLLHRLQEIADGRQPRQIDA